MSSNELLDKVWSCKCWFCRLFTRRILSYFLHKASAYAQIPCEKGGVTVSEEVSITKELKELKNAIDELKQAIVEIKTTIADLTGPFSLYRASEEVGKPSAQVTQQIQRTEAEASKPVEKPVEKEAGLPGRRELPQLLTGISEALREERAKRAEVSFKKMLNTMRVLYELRRLYPRSNIETIVRMLEEIRVLSPDEISVLKAAANLVEESLREDISYEENTLMMLTLLKNMGIRSNELEEEAFRVAVDLLAARRQRARELGKSGVTKADERGDNTSVSLQQ